MPELWSVAIGLVLGSGVVGLLRVGIGPTRFDRMLAAQLVGTSSVAALVAAAHVLNLSALLDVALLMALLAAVVTIAMVNGGARSKS